MEACFRLGGRLYCVPVAIKKLPVPVVEEPGNPDPFPAWIRTDAISPDVIEDLSVLASMDVLVKELRTPALIERFSKTLSEAVGDLGLPEEINIHFHGAGHEHGAG